LKGKQNLLGTIKNFKISLMRDFVFFNYFKAVKI